MIEITVSNLMQLAVKTSEHSYSPYSSLRVGAALLCSDGSVFTGTNIENASYSLSICAERVAAFKALSEGKRHFERIAVFADTPEVITPCGACLQVLAQFAPESKDLLVTCGNKERQITKRLSELLLRPFSFGSGKSL
jgi:cytidine deaminase